MESCFLIKSTHKLGTERIRLTESLSAQSAFSCLSLPFQKQFVMRIVMSTNANSEYWFSDKLNPYSENEAESGYSVTGVEAWFRRYARAGDSCMYVRTA
jgi:hypothetical protein